MILSKISFFSWSKTSTALFTTRSISTSSSWVKDASWNSCLRRVSRNVALDALSWAAKDLICSGATWFSRLRGKKWLWSRVLKDKLHTNVKCDVLMTHYWPLAVFMASDMCRLQAWSVWWTTLVAHFRRSASCTVRDNSTNEFCISNFLLLTDLRGDKSAHLLFSVVYRRAQWVAKWGRDQLNHPLAEDKPDKKRRGNTWLLNLCPWASVIHVNDNLFCGLTCHMWTNCLWCWLKCCLSPMSISVDLETPNDSPSPISRQRGLVWTWSGFCWCRTPHHTVDTPGRNPVSLKKTKRKMN